MKRRPTPAEIILAICVVIQVAGNLLLVRISRDAIAEAAYLTKSEAQAWGAYHELRATYGAMEVF